MKTKRSFLRIATLNAQNLFLLDDPYEYQKKTILKKFQPNKPLHKTIDLGKAILEMDPDILMISEVGGEESLCNFNSKYCNNYFSPTLIKGNSDRGIDLGFLIKRGMPFSYNHYTHKNRSINFNYEFEKKENEKKKKQNLPPSYQPHRFSRDIAELRIFPKGQNETPILILLSVHLKSQLDFGGYDENGSKRRRAELKTLIDVYLKLQKKYDNKVPILIGGDFNGNAQFSNSDPEFQYLYEKTDLKDILELIDIPVNQRSTLLHSTSNNEKKSLQFDYIFLSEKLKPVIRQKDSGIYRYKDPETGVPLPFPQDDSDLRHFPSDHYPLVLDFSLSK